MCTVGTCGLHGCAMTETPAAQKRGSASARNLRREFRRERAVDDGTMHAHLSNRRPRSMAIRPPPPGAPLASVRSQGSIANRPAGDPRPRRRTRAQAPPCGDDPSLQGSNQSRTPGRNAGHRPKLNCSWRSLVAHPGDQALDMLDRRFRQDAVAEIENMRAPLKAAQHALDLFVEAPSARNEREGIEIALERDPLGQSGDGGSGIGGGVEANRVIPARPANLASCARRRAERRSATLAAFRRELWPRSP